MYDLHIFIAIITIIKWNLLEGRVVHGLFSSHTRTETDVNFQYFFPIKKNHYLFELSIGQQDKYIYKNKNKN